MAFVYWIKHRNHTDILTQGYVGITVDFQKRILKHLSVAKTQDGDIIHKAIRKYESDIEFLKICECDYEYAIYMEEKLRPEPLLGWNILKGGNRGRYGLAQTDLQKRSVSEALRGRQGNTQALSLALEARKQKGCSTEESKKRSEAMLEKHILDFKSSDFNLLSRTNEIYNLFLQGKKSYAISTKLNLPRHGFRSLFRRFYSGYNPLEDERMQNYISDYLNKYGIYEKGKEVSFLSKSESFIFKGIFRNKRGNIIAYVDFQGKRFSKTFNTVRVDYQKALFDACLFLKEKYTEMNRSSDLQNLEVFIKNNLENAA